MLAAGATYTSICVNISGNYVNAGIVRCRRYANVDVNVAVDVAILLLSHNWLLLLNT